MAETNKSDKTWVIIGAILLIVGIIMIVYGGLYLSQAAECSGINFTEGSSGTTTTDDQNTSGSCTTSSSTGGWLLGLGLVFFFVGAFMIYRGRNYDNMKNAMNDIVKIPSGETITVTKTTSTPATPPAEL